MRYLCSQGFEQFQVRGHLAHKKTPPPRTLQYDHAWGPVGFLGRWALPYEQRNSVRHLKKIGAKALQRQGLRTAVSVLSIENDLHSEKCCKRNSTQLRKVRLIGFGVRAPMYGGPQTQVRRVPQLVLPQLPVSSVHASKDTLRPRVLCKVFKYCNKPRA